MTEKYKEIVVQLQKKPVQNDKEAVEFLNKNYRKKDLYFEFEENKLKSFLRLLDLNKLKDDLEYLKSNKKLGNYNSFLKILEKIESIKSYGVKNGKRLYVEYNKERKVQNRKKKVKRRGLHYYAEDNDFSEKNNELQEEFVNKIVCGDSEEVLKKLPDNCIDLVFTSPPYNFGLEYENSEDGINWNKYFEKLFVVFDECIRVLKYGGRIIVNVQPLFSDYVPIHHIISNHFMKKKMIWMGEIMWEKNNYSCKYTAWGSWKSPSKPYLKYTWEFVEVFTKGTLKKEGIRNKIDISGDEFKKWVYGKWGIAPERKMKDFEHPAMFPEELVKRVLKLFSYQDNIILDPFNGVGTTTKVAKQTGRKYLGIDLSKDYCKKAENRLKELS